MGLWWDLIHQYNFFLVTKTLIRFRISNFVSVALFFCKKLHKRARGHRDRQMIMAIAIEAEILGSNTILHMYISKLKYFFVHSFLLFSKFCAKH